MKISSKLEEMVADLVSDERKKREEVEAVLSKIHEMTEAYFDPEKEALRELAGGDTEERIQAMYAGAPPEPEDFEPAPRLDYQTRWNNFKKFRENMGDPPARAEEVATEMCGEEPDG